MCWAISRPGGLKRKSSKIFLNSRREAFERVSRLRLTASLFGIQRQATLSDVSTISVTDLKKKPARQWRSAKKDQVIVTSDGKPVAVLLPVNSESLAPTLSTLRSVRALQAQTALQQAAAANGTDKLTMADIDAEISAVRRARRAK
jgi:prevent-host-death family protein